MLSKKEPCVVHGLSVFFFFQELQKIRPPARKKNGGKLWAGPPTWNKMTDNIIAKNTNKFCIWTIFTTKKIDKLSAAHGKVGTASVLTKSGKKKFMECWKSTILAHHVMALLTPDAKGVHIGKHKYIKT